jgi:hypothetical protein
MADLQLAQILNHDNPQAIFDEVRKTYLYYYSESSFLVVEHVYDLIVHLFKGEYPGYLACKTEYHDLTHTLDALLSCSRLMDGKNLSEKSLSEDTAMRLCCAALLHDTGYIQDASDNIGTGAKYTSNHVDRSISFVRRNHSEFGLTAEDVDKISLLISCTGLKNKWEDISFSNEEEMRAGAILATSDLLGQMSDRQYLEKLLFLYYEFREAGIEGYNTEFDILRKTLDFYETTKNRLENTLLGSYHYAQIHFKERYYTDANLYILAIERQMGYLKNIIADESSNFRHKLKRIDLGVAETRFRA